MSGVATRRCDVAVIGAGMAGMAAALFAAQRGLSCVQVGNAGGLLFASGLLDLLAVHPVTLGSTWQDPFAALAALARDEPGHPLARVGAAAIHDAFDSFIGALGAAGLPYAPLTGRNQAMPTSLGTIKTTYAVPRSMAAGVAALTARPPCLLVELRGLREFSARQVVATLGASWPGLRHGQVELPGMDAAAEIYAAHVARGLEAREVRERTIDRVKPLVGDARAVGFPAVLGLARSADVHAAFEAALGVPVFEMPTMPTSVPGLRLLASLESAVAVRGVRRYPRAEVRALALGADGDAATLELAGTAGNEGSERIVAGAVVLATGRFSGRGLVADRAQVREAILGLPVAQPGSREAWHRRDFLDPAGHAINRAGLVVDDAWRPLDARGKPAWQRLHAIGSILAHQDWIRAKCGSGLAIATAWAAIDHVAGALGAAGAGAEIGAVAGAGN
jgi:glycerol-3-phosphate dehydrogenase subunit B